MSKDILEELNFSDGIEEVMKHLNYVDKPIIFPGTSGVGKKLLMDTEGGYMGYRPGEIAMLPDAPFNPYISSSPMVFTQLPLFMMREMMFGGARCKCGRREMDFESPYHFINHKIMCTGGIQAIEKIHLQSFKDFLKEQNNVVKPRKLPNDVEDRIKEFHRNSKKWPIGFEDIGVGKTLIPYPMGFSEMMYENSPMETMDRLFHGIVGSPKNVEKDAKIKHSKKGKKKRKK